MEKRLQDKIDDYYQLAQYHMKLAQNIINIKLYSIFVIQHSSP
jgi:hypothetical protein